ncbi:MAG: NADH-quinone oxidoreductase subunit NuoN [Thermoprotei archaeon]
MIGLENYVPIVVPSVVVLIVSILVLPLRSFKAVVALGSFSLVASIISELYGYFLGLQPYSLFSSQVRIDLTYYLFSLITDVTGLFVILGTYSVIQDWPTRNSFVSLTLLTILGIHYLSAFQSVPMFLMGWGISSAAVYALAMLSKDRLSVVAGVKYLVMGVISSSLIVLGLAFFVAFTGSLSFVGVQVNSGVIIAVILLSVAFMFKLGTFPFHTWLPDLYSKGDRGSLIAVASIGKLVAVAPFVRVLTLLDPTPALTQTEIEVFSVLAIATLIFGNVMAFGRKDLSEMIAYSSVAQAGYFLLAFAMISVSPAPAFIGLITQTLTYTIAQAGIFAGIAYIEKSSGSSEYKALRGFASGDRLAAFSFIVLLLSLLGVPPIIGFWAKLYIFESTFPYPILTILGLLNSAASAGYYIQPFREMFAGGKWNVVPSPERATLVGAAFLSITLGLYLPLLLVGVTI